MSSTFFGLQTALRGLNAQQAAEDTISQNIVNANTPGYSRQTVQLVETDPFPAPNYNREQMVGQIGTGVEAAAITTVRDAQLNSNINTSNSQVAYSAAMADKLNELQSYLNEPSTTNLGDSLDSFWSALSDVSNNPTDTGVKQNLVNVADSLATNFNSISSNLDSITTDLNTGVKTDVQSINNLASTISSVNMQIFKAEAMGYQPNDLIDQRDTMLNKLSTYTDFQVTNLNDGMIKVDIHGHTLVGNDYFNTMGTVNDPSNNNNTKVTWTDDGSDAVISGGEIKAYTDMRDTSIPGYRTTLDGIANTVITQVNQLQQTGYTSTGSAPTGIDFFTGTGIKDMAVNPAIQSDATQVATAKSANSPGDGTNALAMADLKDALTMAGGTATINQSYSNFITQIGSDTASAQNENSINTSVNSTLQSKWQSLSGVSLDEEMTNLIMYQHAYDASTKVMKVQDDMLQSLIDMMATV